MFCKSDNSTFSVNIRMPVKKKKKTGYNLADHNANFFI